MLTHYSRALSRTHLSEASIAERLGDIRRLSNTIPNVLEATASDLREYLETKRSAAYRKRILESLRAFYRWAHSNGHIAHDPAAELEPVRLPRRPALPATPNEVVLSAFEEGTLHERAIIALAATLGLRRNEIATLHPIDRRGRTLRVLGKNQTVRELPTDELTHALLVELEKEQGTETYYFPGRFGGHVHSATVYSWAKRLLGPDWTLHACRRRAATEGFKANPNIYALRDFLGHVQLATTVHYVSVTADDIERLVEGTSLTRTTPLRRVAGMPHTSQETIDDKAQLLRDFVDLAARARTHGLDVVLR